MEAVIQQAGLERTSLPVKKKRIGSVDICKGIAMIYVLIVHFFPGAMGLSTAIGLCFIFTMPSRLTFISRRGRRGRTSRGG